MHLKLVVAALAALSFAGIAVAQEGLFQRDHGKLAPPALLDAPAVSAPAEGVGPGGLDFGQWRNANAQTYGLAFQARTRAFVAGKTLSAAREDLTRNGFTCRTPGDRGGAGPALECRLATVVAACNHEWWVVLEDAAATAKASRDVMCAR